MCPRQSWRPLAQQAINWQMPDPEVVSDIVNYENIKVRLLESMAVPRKVLFKHFGKCIVWCYSCGLIVFVLGPFSLCVASQSSVNTRTIQYGQSLIFKGQFSCLEYSTNCGMPKQLWLSLLCGSLLFSWCVELCSTYLCHTSQRWPIKPHKWKELQNWSLWTKFLSLPFFF